MHDSNLFRGIHTSKCPRIIAHRGASGDAPENTIAAFARAFEDGADILEMDVRPAADGQIIVCHDRCLERTTDGTGCVDEMTLEQLKALDAGFHFTKDHGRTFPFRDKGVRIPTLQEVLIRFPMMLLNIELKANSPRFFADVIALLERHKRLEDVMFLVGGNSHSLVKMIRSAAPSAESGHSRREILTFLLLSKLRCPFLFRPKSRIIQIPDRYRGWKVATPLLVNHAHRLGMEVHIWTVNDEARMRECLESGVDGIFTDFPARMKKVIGSLDCSKK